MLSFGRHSSLSSGAALSAREVSLCMRFQLLTKRSVSGLLIVRSSDSWDQRLSRHYPVKQREPQLKAGSPGFLRPLEKIDEQILSPMLRALSLTSCQIARPFQTGEIDFTVAPWKAPALGYR